MTTIDRTLRHPSHETRIHLVSEGVLASYIHDISARTAAAATARRPRRSVSAPLARATREGSGWKPCMA